jgi:hypothetical protein
LEYSYGVDEHNGEYVEHDGYQAQAIYFIRGEAIIDVAQQPPPPIAHELELTMKELTWLQDRVNAFAHPVLQQELRK